MPELILTMAAGPERVIEELLGAAPGHLHRFADGLGQPGGLDRLRVPASCRRTRRRQTG